MDDVTFDGKKVNFLTFFPYKKDKMWDTKYRRENLNESLDKEELTRFFGEKFCQRILNEIGDRRLVVVVSSFDRLTDYVGEDPNRRVNLLAAHLCYTDKHGIRMTVVTVMTPQWESHYTITNGYDEKVQSLLYDTIALNFSWTYTKKDFRETVLEIAQDMEKEKTFDMCLFRIIYHLGIGTCNHQYVVQMLRLSEIDELNLENCGIVFEDGIVTTVPLFLVPKDQYTSIFKTDVDVFNGEYTHLGWFVFKIPQDSDSVSEDTGYIFSSNNTKFSEEDLKKAHDLIRVKTHTKVREFAQNRSTQSKEIHQGG